MSRTALAKIWSFFALSTLTLSFLFFLRTTGAQPKSDDLGVMGYNAATISILALPLEMVLFGVLLWLTWVWSESVADRAWAQRIPIFHFEAKDVDTTSRGGRIYQRWSFSLALVAPLLLIFQMADRFFRGSVYLQYTQPVFAEGSALFDFGKLSSATEMLRFGEPKGPQFFCWEPWLFAVLLCGLLAGWVVTLRSVFRA